MLTWQSPVPRQLCRLGSERRQVAAQLHHCLAVLELQQLRSQQPGAAVAAWLARRLAAVSWVAVQSHGPGPAPFRGTEWGSARSVSLDMAHTWPSPEGQTWFW